MTARVALVTGGYKATLFYLTGKVNGGPFKGFAPGEVLFLGASGSQRGSEDFGLFGRSSKSATRQPCFAARRTNLSPRPTNQASLASAKVGASLAWSE